MQKTILVVEDEFLIAMDLQLLLEDHGWRVIGPVATVKAALALLENELPSVALLDVSLRNEFVTAVAETLKTRGVPFALASAYEKPERFGGEVLSGAPNVGKPTGERRLISFLSQLTANRSAATAREPRVLAQPVPASTTRGLPSRTSLLVRSLVVALVHPALALAATAL